MRTNIHTGIKGVIRLVFKQRMQCYGRALTTVTFECNNLKLCQNYHHETPGEVDKFLQICSGTASDLLFIQEGRVPDFSFKCFVCCHIRKLAAEKRKVSRPRIHSRMDSWMDHTGASLANRIGNAAEIKKDRANLIANAFQLHSVEIYSARLPMYNRT